MFSVHGPQSEMYLRALNCYTMGKCVIRCPEMSPLPPLPTCQSKYLMWKSRYRRSQLDCTKGPVSLLCCRCLFQNTILLMRWVTVYSRIKGWRRDFGISLSSSVFLLWNPGVFLFALCFFFISPLPCFHKWRRGEIVCMCVCGALPSRETKQTTSIAFALTSLT